MCKSGGTTKRLAHHFFFFTEASFPSVSRFTSCSFVGGPFEGLRIFIDRERRGGPVPQPDYVYSNLIHKAYYLDVQHEHCLPPIKVSAGQVDPEALQDRFCFNSQFTELVGCRGATGSES